MAAFSAGEIEALLRLRDEMSPALQIASRNVAGMGAMASKAGRDLLPLSAAFAFVGIAAIKMAGDFDAAMSESLAILPPFSDAMRAGLEDTARRVALTTKASATEAAQAYYYLASAGVQTAGELERALPLIAQFAQAGMINMSQATEYLTDSIRALGLTVDKDMGRVGDVIVRMAVLSNTTVQQLAESLTTKAAAAMRIFGVSVEEGAAVLAVYADRGIKGTIAGERFDILLRTLTRSAKHNAEAFKENNVALYDAKGALLPLDQIVRQLEVSFGAMSVKQRVAALDMMGIRAQSQSAILSLIGASTEIARYRGEAERAGGSMKTIAENQMKSFNMQMDLLVKGVKDAGIEIGLSLLPILLKLGKEVLAPLIENLRKSAEQFSKWPAPLQAAALAFGTLAALFAPALIFFGMMATAVTSLIGLFGLKAAAVTVDAVATGASTVATTAKVVALTSESVASGAGVIAIEAHATAINASIFATEASAISLGTQTTAVNASSLAATQGALATKALALSMGTLMIAMAGLAAGWVIGKLILGLIESCEAGRKAVADLDAAFVHAFTDGVDLVTLEQGRNAINSMTAAEKEAYFAFIKSKQGIDAKRVAQEKAEAVAINAAALTRAGIQATLQDIRETDILKQANEALGRTIDGTLPMIEDLATAKMVLAEKARFAKDGTEKLSKSQRELAADLQRAAEAMKKLSESYTGEKANAELAKLSEIFVANRAAIEANIPGYVRFREEVIKLAKEATLIPAPLKAMAVSMDGVKAAFAAQILANQKKAFEDLGITLISTKGLWTKYADVVDQELENADTAIEEHGDEFDGLTGQMLNWVETNIQAIEEISSNFRELGDEFEGTAGSIFSALADVGEGLQAGVKGAQDWARAQGVAGKVAAGMNVAMAAYKGNALSGAVAGATFGASFGPIGAAVGAVAGGLLGFFGAAKRAREEAARLKAEIEKQRAAFISAQGGIEILTIAAREAGVSLTAMMNAKTVAEYEAAVRNVEQAIKSMEEGIELTKEAMERWGLTAADMGPAFRSGMLHEALGEIYRDFMLLTTAGADAARVLGDPSDPESMASAINDIVHQSIAAGVALPETMRPMIAKMIELGLLFDENGVKITDISQLTFTETLEAGVARLIAQIERLVIALGGIPEDVHTNIHVNYPDGPPYDNPENPHNPNGPNQPDTAIGGLFPFRRGGYARTIGEAGDEAVVPMSGKGAFASGFAKMLAAEVAKTTGGGGGGGVYIVTEGSARQVTESEFRQIAGAIGNGRIPIPARVVGQRV